ncbi:adenylyltransferase/cytidyltransferase family protein [Pseudomonas fluorescens]|uniref:Glycerol-3-phosphate cytidylyltransferase n=1 Tax=Pseudomonas fluorescens TaxID=294 RepID=A0A5E7FUF1_PSEFL|nr:adenylyltransferase/cytidyltransferase family protein [Pseudomonas fluorescens]VVO42272.1 Glycerol-3-phosphate cytidylyltransferase [Pseudomonas fluorescens]
MNKKIVITYGTFDLFHIGHLNLLQRLKEYGDYLIVGVSTDEFNAGKNKQTIVPFGDRLEIVRNIKCVDLAIPEATWDQKTRDISQYNVTTFGMGHDWEGKFDELKEFCEVVYLPRTPNISSTDIKQILKVLDKSHVTELKQALDIISSIVERFE